MKISSYLEYLAKDINENLHLNPIAKINILDRNREAVCIRQMPSNNEYYYQGARSINFRYQILVKSESSIKALKKIESITEYLENKGAVIYTEPLFVSKDEQGYLYSASLETKL